MAAAVCLVAVGCGGGKARVKGKVVDNGEPVKFPPTTASVQLTPVGPDGRPDVNSAVTCVVNEDGTFELLASGGEAPPGKYHVTLNLTGGKGPPKAQAIAGKAIERELKSGQNELTIDLSRPEG